MKNIFVWLGALVLLNGALLFARGTTSDRGREDGLRLGIVFDVGGRGDKSFNDGAYDGAMRTKRELGARVTLVEPGEGADREAGLRLLAAEGHDLVIGVGFIFSDDLAQLAIEYPSVSFAGVDFATKMKDGKAVPPPPNLAALKFREEEGSFLVGAVAGLVTKSRVVGFIGGMDIPLIHKFEAGYRAGVRTVCEACRVLVHYAGVTPEAFRNPGKGKELALSQIQSGADILFQAAGSTGLGVFEAARAAGKLAIGTDADQSHEAPGTVLTSMVKRIETVVFEAARRVRDKTFQGGIYSFGLRERGVGYVYGDSNRHLISERVKARVDALAEDIIAGRIAPPTMRTEKRPP
jgi:basic membrane protein A